LLVVVHGQSRTAGRYAERFADFADRHGYLVLAPLFPSAARYQELGLGTPHRADLQLLSLVQEVASAHAVEASRFDLFGYSGGGQFAHRFLYLHPTRLRSVVVGAPGTVTLPDSRQSWPVGVANLASLAGAPLNLEPLRRTRVLLMVGQEDLSQRALRRNQRAMQAGATRLGRARTLHAAWLLAGLEHEYLEVPGASHRLGRRLLEPVERFLTAGL
jgi:poly(3-hydroxybutyrate) depolymerase